MTPWPDFSRRSAALELMDERGVPADELHRTLDELSVINRWLGGYAPSLDGLASLLPPGAREFSVLDVGCGGGDTARRIAAWAAARGLTARVLGIDRSADCVEYARRRSARWPSLRFAALDLDELCVPDAFDVVHAALVLHHFPPRGAAAGLRRMHALSRRGVVVNDLHRHGAAYGSIRALTALFSRNRLIRNDAPLSVLRGFSRGELLALAREAELPRPRLRWRWAFRWEMVVPK